MFPIAVTLLIIGYGVAYWGLLNFRSGGAGPGFAETFGLSGTLGVADQVGAGGAFGGKIGQPPTSNQSPGAAVRYV